MCGIAGAFGKRRPDDRQVAHARRALRHRGPDADGVHRGRVREHEVTLVATRLAIIDLDRRADQPFVADGCALVHNGEIYNYVELRAELEGLGHRFVTASDTEVIVKAYRQWGEACVERFEGMWAFALLDEREGCLVLSRDRFGEKPLFWWIRGETLYFASEIKALAALSGARPGVDEDQVCRYLVNGYRSLYKKPRSFFRDIAEFPAAAVAVLTGPRAPDPRPYWSLAYAPVAMAREAAAHGALERLTEALRLRLRADVPVALCLSGGIDSSLLAGLAVRRLDQEIHAFSIIDSDARYDESANVAATVAALGCEHHAIPTRRDGFFERMERLVAAHDAPVATISYLVHSFLSEAIAASGYKVAISGTGADELFTGYYDHYGFWLAEMERTSDVAPFVEEWKSSYGAFVDNPLLQDPLAFVRDPEARAHIFLNADVFESFLARRFHEDFSETPYTPDGLRNRMLNELHHEVVPVILKEDDLNSMHYSVENRSPYLDRGLAEFAYSVPTRHLIHGGHVKWLLREAGRGVMAEAVRADKRKRGFNASIDSVIDRTDPETRERLLAPGPIFDIVRRDAIDAFMTGDMSDNSFSKFLFGFISARLFLESELVTGAAAAVDAA